jgi:hypothetical protein
MRMEIKAELQQPTDYLTFSILDSGEDIPICYQKVYYHMIFDIKYDLMHKVRLDSLGKKDGIIRD